MAHAAPAPEAAARANELIRKRYTRLAPIYYVIDRIFPLAWWVRQRAVDRMALQPGSRALEIGCGAGRNFPLLQRAVGPTGHIYGVDLTPGMLAMAAERCRRHGWTNVTLLQSDAARFTLSEPVDAALFGLSYSLIPDHQSALRAAWQHLTPGGRVVVVDGKRADNWLGRLMSSVAIAVNRATVYGTLEKKAWEDLRALTDAVEMQEMLFGSYFVCTGIKTPEVNGE